MNAIRIRCPKFQWEPDGRPYWRCSCGQLRNTFATGGRCPKCQKAWEDTQCLHPDGAVRELTEVVSERVVAAQVERSALPSWAYPFALLFLWLAIAQDAGGQTPKAGVLVDTTITGFHYAIDYSGTSVYTQHGPSDINRGNQPTAFSVTLSRTVSFEQAKKQVLQLLRWSIQSGYHISDLTQKDTVFKGHPAYCVSYTETLEKEGYQNLVFNAVVNGDAVVLVFTSGDLDKGKFIEGIKKTFYQLDF
jgi:hypothetical protein